MKTLLLLSMAALFGVQQPSPADATAMAFHGVAFDFDPRADAHTPSYTLSFNANGTGKYIEYPMDIPDGPAARPVFLTVSAATLQRLMAAHDAVMHSAPTGDCGTRHRNIASTGKKKLTFYDGDQSVSCDFDFSDDARVEDCAAAFQAMAETLRFSDRLDHEHRFDRLGLDAEMDSLVSENAAGRAIELQNIARTLQSIVDDDRVIERVRRKAARLLQDAAGTPAPKAANSR
jgi:hypothetical protein